MRGRWKQGSHCRRWMDDHYYYCFPFRPETLIPFFIISLTRTFVDSCCSSSSVTLRYIYTHTLTNSYLNITNYMIIKMMIQTEWPFWSSWRNGNQSVPSIQSTRNKQWDWKKLTILLSTVTSLPPTQWSIIEMGLESHYDYHAGHENHKSHGMCHYI
jgi:hypothetical protein